MVMVAQRVVEKTKQISVEKSEDFIAEAKRIYGSKFSYSKTEYVNAKTKVTITCSKHGDFNCLPLSHLRNKGNGLTGACKKCGYESNSKTQRHTQAQVIKKFRKAHGNTYSYTKTVYINDSTKVIVTCKIHGDFLITPNKHFTRKSGCPFCKKSIGENTIKLILTRQNIDFISEKRFSSCKSLKPLPFDFFLPRYNILIEFQGQQHFEATKNKGWNNTKNLIKVRKHDKIKRDWCTKNRYYLLEITYDEIDIAEQLILAAIYTTKL